MLRIWVLKSAYNYFDDMRQKYAETSSCKYDFSLQQDIESQIPKSLSEIPCEKMCASLRYPKNSQ